MSYSGDQHLDLEGDDEWSDEDEDRLFTLAWRAIKERKGKFTGEEDVDKFLREHSDVVKQARDGFPNLLHAIVELLKNFDINSLDDVLPLVQRLVQEYPYFLHTGNGRDQNPLFFAISKKKWTLADYMIRYCDDNPQAKLCLQKALEMPCSTEKAKTCLHLAFEAKSKPSLLLKLVKLANEKALEARDSDGKTPLHYAVEYSHCIDERVEIIKIFLERDEKMVMEHTKTASSRPLETFLDLKDKSNRSVYQEHLATAERYKRLEAEKKGPWEAAESYTHQEADEFKDRNAALPARLDHEAALRLKDPTNSERAGDDAMQQRGRIQGGLKEGEKIQKTDEATNNRIKSFPGNSETVLRILKLHYMRTRDIQKATLWLYGSNSKGIQIFFDYKGLPEDISGDLFKKTFSAMQFDDVLKYVRFTHVTVRRRKTPRDKAKGLGAELGRRDMEFFLDWLYDKGVRYILKLTVEENGETVHSDEAIKTALDKVMIEHLDWQKTDLNPEVICGISTQAEDRLTNKDDDESYRNKLRVLDLRWSGDNAVLQAWSEPQGLPLLQNLQTVNVVIPENVIYNSEKWVEKEIDNFRIRLNKNIAVASATKDDAFSSSERRVSILAAGLSGRQSLPMTPKKVSTSHEWMDCMERFAQKMKPFWDDMLDRSKARRGDCQGDMSKVTATTIEDDVVVALIDDGVGPLDEYFAGKTFDYHDGEVGQPYTSDQSHGTEMAKLILRVCPMAKIYPIRLKTYPSATGESRIDLESAALAIKAAREKDARILSMSWTIPVPTGEEHRRARELIKNSIDEACEDERILFCSSADTGQFTSNTYPSNAKRDSLFRIGAAKDDGTPFRYVDRDVDYIFPGVKVSSQSTAAGREEPLREFTGSSVATALAAGLAAMIIYCFKISALATNIARTRENPLDTLPSIQFGEKHVRNIAEFPAMQTAFSQIGVINDARFIQVWDLFDPVSQILDDPGRTHEEKVESIVMLCANLVDWKRELRSLLR